MRMKLNILKVYILAVLLLVVCFFAFGFNKGGNVFAQGGVCYPIGGGCGSSCSGSCSVSTTYPACCSNPNQQTCVCANGSWQCVECASTSCSGIPNKGDPLNPPTCTYNDCGDPGCYRNGISYTYKCGTICYDSTCGADACGGGSGPYCGDGKIDSGEECEGGGLCTCDGCGGDYEDKTGICSSCKCCVRCSASCPNPLVSSSPVNPPHEVSEYFFDNITSCEDRSTCENPETKYADCYEILSNQPTVSLNIHPELVPTTLSFTSDTHTGSGTYKENGTISDDTVNDFMPYSSIRYQNEDNLFYFEATFSDTDYPIESAYVWFSKSAIKPVTPKSIDLDNSVTPNKYGTKSNSEFGFLLYHNLNTDSWIPYIPAISGSGDSATDVWKQAKSYSDVEIIDGKTVFSVPASNGQKTAKVLLYSITPANSGKKIVVKFSISFKSSGEALLPKLPDEGRYNIWMMANDTFGFTPYDNYEEYSDIVKNAIKNKWITNERIRYYDQWIDSGKDWNLNFDIPGVNLMITPSESVRTGLDISWEFDGDSDFPDNEFSDLVINLYKTEELNIPDEITLSNIHNGGGEVDSNSPFQPKVDGQHTDRIGSLNVSNNYYLLKIHGGSGNGSATLNFGNVGQGKIYFYITVFDKGGNVGVLERSFNLSDWIITHGGLLYSKDVNFEINLSKEPDDWDEKPLLKSIKYDHADISTELVGIGSLGIPTSPVKSENTSSYMLRPYKVEDPKNGYYQTYKGYFDRKKTYIPNLNDLGNFDTLQGSLSTLGDGIAQNEIASVEADEDLTVNMNFNCDRRGVFFVAGNLTIGGKITNGNLNRDALSQTKTSLHRHDGDRLIVPEISVAPEQIEKLFKIIN